MKTLVIVAHPALHRSRINAHLMQVAGELDDVSILDLYNTYPDFDIDAEAEKDRLRAAEAVVLQHPLYWYATPALLKEWVDITFQFGFAYGDAKYGDAKELGGKCFTQAISTGGGEEVYGSEGFNRFSMNELTYPMQATAKFCGMKWCEPFITHDGLAISDERLSEIGASYAEWLKQLKAGDA